MIHYNKPQLISLDGNTTHGRGVSPQGVCLAGSNHTSHCAYGSQPSGNVCDAGLSATAGACVSVGGTNFGGPCRTTGIGASVGTCSTGIEVRAS